MTFNERYIRQYALCQTCRWRKAEACVLPRCFKWEDDRQAEDQAAQAARRLMDGHGSHDPEQ